MHTFKLIANIDNEKTRKMYESFIKQIKEEMSFRSNFNSKRDMQINKKLRLLVERDIPSIIMMQRTDAEVVLLINELINNIY